MTEDFKQHTVFVLVENGDFEGHVEYDLMQILVIDVVALGSSVDVAA
jgi:hypothetical protein